jgi:putative Mg2+ transporter-C (MgtC) family protein
LDAVWREIVARGDEFNVLPHLLALSIAYVLALPIGWDREKDERSAGLRTFPLVAIASCGFLQATETVILGNAEATARVVEGIITGMGFIGGGAILVVKASVRGTATAASLWATGAIGTAVGLGAYDIAVVISLVTFVTLRAVNPLKRRDEDGRATEESARARD